MDSLQINMARSCAVVLILLVAYDIYNHYLKQKVSEIMSKFSRFMKVNKATKENGFYAATKSLCDEKGKPLLWEFKPITSKENTELRESCMMDVPVTGKPNVTRPKFRSWLYVRKLIAASVVTPDLYDAELQDSYGVSTPEDLLMAMVDDPGEFDDLSAFVERFQGFDKSMDGKVDEAKN